MLGLKFDAAKLSVTGVAFGDVYGPALANNPTTPFLNQNGKMYVSLPMPQGSVLSNTGILAFIEIEALVDGQTAIEFERDALNFLNAEGKNLKVKF
jgi:hypothetical protein